MTETEILTKLLIESKKKKIKIDKVISENVSILLTHIENNKSLVSALVTSCIKKITDNKQDIRLHRKDFEQGYSARSLDMQITTPFFKQHFPKYANKESSFLTLATREKIKWDLTEGINLKVRNKAVKNSFLFLIDLVQNQNMDEECLLCILKELSILSDAEKKIFDKTIIESKFSNILSINKVIEMLTKHFSMKLSSRLPVIAIYTIYEYLIRDIKRYNKKILRTLNVHTASDKHGYGDVEVWNEDNTPFEIIEIKHNISINRNMLFDIVKKTERTSIQKYYLLTTYPNSFLSNEEEKYINKFILKIKQDTGMEIIANGIITSLKYYLRFIEGYQAFIEAYTKNLVFDAKISTEVKSFHLEQWQNILKGNSIQYD